MRLYTIIQASDKSCLVTVTPVLEGFHIIPEKGLAVLDLHAAINTCIRDQIHDIEMHEIDTTGHLALFSAYSVESDENLTVDPSVIIYSITGEELINKFAREIQDAVNNSKAEMRQAIRDKVQALLKDKGPSESTSE